uniref:Uncharacterized protein n=1 Tax=Candidatus Kentrum sp. TUN TaxID=2126343 RepID=A0A451ACE5_9GAMM|nr:MAG: hypothetical protein BECKTUN1418F_GA0071002_12305 [Candidatus Kentron sp. TUN]VFK63683.1 MAG: hypothetical protein BECKTUN1418D_GA0071000_12225 [Candidatus Kentron sp. TUN]VFK70083.1 MAG: hypothetical protein BECKTUN1418E_GA0071001_12334 [Candidatus Kentron sp. TUN]
MLTLELDRKLESNLLQIAREEQRTPAQIINQLVGQYIKSRQSSDLPVNIAQALPAVEAFSDKDPLSLQQEMRDEWQNLMLAQADSLTDWDNAEDEVWNDAPAI